ncbi:putative transcription factor bHLH87-like [Capsicum annuum]|nr:putative transcription factor bHLH87-like [Capsicum annuum]
MGQKSAPDGHISFVRLLGDPCYCGTMPCSASLYLFPCGISYVEKKEIRSLLKEDPQFWAYRPLSDLMVRAAAADVRFLPYVFHKMMEKLSEQSLWRLAVRGSLCCRCFCISDNELIGQQFLLFQISSMWNEIHWKTRFSPCLMCHPGKWDVLLVEKDPQFCQSKNHASFHHWTPEAGKESRSHVEGPDVVTCEITLFAAPGSQSFYIYNTRLTQAKQTRVKPISLLLLTFILIFHAILSHIGWGC